MLHSPTRFRQWLPALFDGEFVWDFLRPAFAPTKIMPMDFDAVIERNGHVLIFETKAENKEVAQGQRLTLTNEWRIGRTIIHVEGKTPETIRRHAIYWEGAYVEDHAFGSKTLIECDWTDVLFQVRRWFCRANRMAVPTREEWDRELWLLDYERNEVKTLAMPTAKRAA